MLEVDVDDALLLALINPTCKFIKSKNSLLFFMVYVMFNVVALLTSRDARLQGGRVVLGALLCVL